MQITIFKDTNKMQSTVNHGESAWPFQYENLRRNPWHCICVGKQWLSRELPCAMEFGLIDWNAAAPLCDRYTHVYSSHLDKSLGNNIFFFFWKSQVSNWCSQREHILIPTVTAVYVLDRSFFNISQCIEFFLFKVTITRQSHHTRNKGTDLL